MHLVLFSLFTSHHFLFFLLPMNCWFSSTSQMSRRWKNFCVFLYIRTTWNGKVSWVRKFTHGLSPHFSIAKFFTQHRAHAWITRVRGIFDKRMWIAIENGIFDSNMVLPLLQENVTHVNLSSSSSLPVTCSIALVYTIFCVPFDSNRKSKIYAYVPNQRTWDSNLLRRFLHQSNAQMCVSTNHYMRSRRYICTIYLKFLLSFFPSKKGNEKKSNNLCIEIKYLRKSSQNGWAERERIGWNRLCGLIESVAGFWIIIFIKR